MNSHEEKMVNNLRTKGLTNSDILRNALHEYIEKNGGEVNQIFDNNHVKKERLTEVNQLKNDIFDIKKSIEKIEKNLNANNGNVKLTTSNKKTNNVRLW